MEVAQVYAIVAGSLFALVTTINFCLHVWTALQRHSVLVLRHIIYPFFLHRHGLLGPWSRTGFIVRSAYILLNIFCSGFRIKSIAEASNRTGALSLVNLVPLFFGPHLSFLAGLLGLSLHTIRSAHGFAAAVSIFLCTAHAVLTLFGGKSRSAHGSSELYGLIGISSLAFLFFSFLQCIRRPSYEFFLRTHEAVAALCAYAIWRHISKKTVFPGICLYISSGIFVLTFSMELLWMVHRNFTFYRGFSKATLALVRGAIRIKIHVRRPWALRAGQYINIWLPGVGFRSFLESHPFMIVSWTVDENSASREPGLTMVQLLIEPRDGFTHRLLRRAGRTPDETKHLVLYSGPHGSAVSMKQYGSILMIAAGFGIAAQLPYLKELIDGYKRCEVITRRIHLVWQLREQGDELVAKDLIDEALATDASSWILQISIFYSNEKCIQGAEPEGEHGRLYHCGGTFDPRQILAAEIHGDYDRYVDGKMVRWTGKETGTLLVAVSAHDTLRDEMHSLVEAHLEYNVRLLELEYQP